MRIVHGYLSPCGDAFSTKCEDTLPSVLLKKYQSAGVNGIWLHALLSALSPYPFAPRLSQDYKQKRENLRAIIKRCGEYGIKVFLYLNEPRALPSDSLPQYDHLIGWKEKRTLCSAFREYPFSITMLYNSPKTLGPANLWEIECEEKTSTMVCYAFDDYENWLAPYPYEIYISQFEKVIKLWKEGVTILEKAERTPSVEEIIRYAKVALCHFTTDLLQTKYSFVKRLGDRKQMKELISKEKQNAIDLLNLFVTDAKIGYEASNHYFYTYPNLIEKILRMEKFKAQLN